MDFSPHAFTAALFCNTHARTTLSARTGGERTRRVKKLKEETKFSSHVKYVAVSPRDGDGGSGGERERGGEGEVGWWVGGGGEGRGRERAFTETQDEQRAANQPRRSL